MEQGACARALNADGRVLPAGANASFKWAVGEVVRERGVALAVHHEEGASFRKHTSKYGQKKSA